MQACSFVYLVALCTRDYIVYSWCPPRVLKSLSTVLLLYVVFGVQHKVVLTYSTGDRSGTQFGVVILLIVTGDFVGVLPIRNTVCASPHYVVARG